MSELRGLKWNHVDLDGKVINVCERTDRYRSTAKPKSESGSRDVPLAPIVLNALKQWKLASPNGGLDLVFPNRRGGHLDDKAITERLARPQLASGIVKANGRHRYSPHAFRHFCASWLIDEGLSPKRIQTLMGHAGINIMFSTYGHWFPDGEADQKKLAAAERAILNA